MLPAALIGPSQRALAASACCGACRGLVTATRPKPVKRFYDAASAQRTGNLWRVALDSRFVKTPKGSFLELPSRALAEGVAEEWAAQGEHVRPQEMPLTTIGCTAIDLVQPEGEACVSRIMPYLAMDTLCFEDDNELLRQRQDSEWGPPRRWFEERFGVTLAVAKGFSVPAHPEETLAAVEADLRRRDAWELCALEIATSTAKSLVVAAALMDREELAASDAMRWALLEEHFQIERWGLVEGEHDVSHSDSLLWLEATQRFAKGRRGPPE